MASPAEQLPHFVDRRSRVSRRREPYDGSSGCYRGDDRRLGLGRRWEDWCRPDVRPAKADDGSFTGG
jgi:hypothetical protein